MRKRNFINSALVSLLLAGLTLSAVGSLSACAFFNNGRSVYDREGIRIGINADPTVRRSIPTDLNNHPIALTPMEFESLLQVIQVSGFSGTLVGMLTTPQPVPLLTPQELSKISGPLAAAFREAKPTERVSFSLPKPNVTYSEDRTTGFLFFRGRYLHVVLTDHASFIHTDTGGGESHDIRDTKGMRLWVAGPASTVMVSNVEEPRWPYFEKIHISLAVKEILAQKENSPAAGTNQGLIRAAGSLPPASPPESLHQSVSPDDVQRQIRDLSRTNQDLRGRLDEQHKRMQELQDQVERLRRGLP
ncbi:MAG: DUF3450 domain-containing protein [Nitrospira sp. BO4]|jgi:hypothetical protein|nr:DUF3450 domain-containing protein [Nitrospira sp. BO4]